MQPTHYSRGAASAALTPVILVAGWCYLSVAACGQGVLDRDEEAIGHADGNRVVTPVNQILTPLGVQVDLPGMRPQAIALSPQGNVLVASGKTSELAVLDPENGRIRSRVQLPNEAAALALDQPASAQILMPDTQGQLSYTGLIFSPTGDWIYMSNVEGSIKVFAVAADGGIRPSHTWPLPAADAPRRSAEIPSGLSVSVDGKRLYVCGNLSNRLLEIDAVSGRAMRTFDVGVAPYDVVVVGTKAYVSNWGGRRPAPGDLTGPAGQGTVVRVDPVRHIASEGSVSVIDLAAGKVTTEILTGLHASGLAIVA